MEMITEVEAKTKWCPFIRVGLVTGKEGAEQLFPPANTLIDGTRLGACAGSECMAWRWEMVSASQLGTIRIPSKETGYCGLAGEASR